VAQAAKPVCKRCKGNRKVIMTIKGVRTLVWCPLCGESAQQASETEQLSKRRMK